MQLLPTHLGTRPGLACEIRPEGVVAARAEDASGVLSAASRADLAPGALVPGLRGGNVADSAAVVTALRTSLEAVMTRTRQVTLVVPDAAVRVLLLDFDALPSKLSEALPIVRFRLKKLLPFDADDAVVSFQVMSSTRGLIRALAVAMPREVLNEYETAVRDAGYEPGAVLPSTLAALAGLGESEPAALVVNAGATAITTAIVSAGVLLLHRSVDLAAVAVPASFAAPEPASRRMLPLVDRDSSAEEWALQEPASYHAEEDGAAPFSPDPIEAEARFQAATVRAESQRYSSELELQQPASAQEIAEAVSVASAYFEDTIRVSAGTLVSAGPLGADELARLLREFAPETAPAVREAVDAQSLAAGAVSQGLPRAWLAGVRGALRS